MESPAARLARTVRSVTRVSRNTGSPPQICGSLIILSWWFIDGLSSGLSKSNHIIARNGTGIGKPRVKLGTFAFLPRERTSWSEAFEKAVSTLRAIMVCGTRADVNFR